MGAGRDGRTLAGCAVDVQLDKVAGVGDGTLHDLRRTAAARIAVTTPPHIVEALLNHRPPVLVRTYQIADRWEDKRAAWEGWSRDPAALVA